MTPYHQHPYPAASEAARSDPADGKNWAWIGAKPVDLRDVEKREAAFKRLKANRDDTVQPVPPKPIQA